MKIGVLCPASPGHLNPMITLGRALADQGHAVTFLAIRDVEEHIRASGLGYHPCAERAFPRGWLRPTLERLGALRGLAGLRYTVDLFCNAARVMYPDLPPKIRALGIEGLVVDQTETVGRTIAEHLDLPMVTVCNALLMNDEPDIPPAFTPWRYAPTTWHRWRNTLAAALFRLLTRSCLRVHNDQRRRWRLPRLPRIDETNSSLAQLAQIPREFDFPRKRLPPYLHYVGPLHRSGDRPAIAFDHDRLNGKPLIYASMGSIQNMITPVFRAIAAACAQLDVQLVISLGRADAEPLADLPGSPIVVPFAPQLELVRRAALVITHGGMNTTMETLAQGVPLVVIPITNDQPAVAARVRWTQTGETIPLKRLTPRRLRRTIERVLTAAVYRERAAAMQQAIERSGGPKAAAAIAERALVTRQPVVARRTEATSLDPVHACSPA